MRSCAFRASAKRVRSHGLRSPPGCRTPLYDALSPGALGGHRIVFERQRKIRQRHLDIAGAQVHMNGSGDLGLPGVDGDLVDA